MSTGKNCFQHPVQTIAMTGLSYRLKDRAAIGEKEDKNRKTKSKSKESSTAELASGWLFTTAQMMRVFWFDSPARSEQHPVDERGKHGGVPWIKSILPALQRNPMQEVRLQKAKLLEIIGKNREEHHAIFLEAQKKYREVAIKLLDRQLAAAREGKPFMLREITALVQPMDHTAEYDRAIRMLELSVDDVITLSRADFANLVQDQWQWTQQWATSASRYVDSAKLRSLQGE